MGLTGLKERCASEGGNGGTARIIVALVIVLILIMLPVGWYFSAEPEPFSVVDNTHELLQTDGASLVVGSVTTAALIEVINTLMDKPGGFLSNDVMPPMVILDNIPAWEYGALIQVRDLARAMRDTLSRSQSQSTEDPDLALAESRFNIVHTSWAIPSAESEYSDGVVYLKKYLQRLADENKADAQFYARADNLNAWLDIVGARLGSLSQRLSASVGQSRINTDLAGDSAAQQSTAAPKELSVKTPWNKIDNVFYEARGSCWALVHFLKAVEVDFEEILVRKNALISLRQIIRELEATQDPVYSPVILNGGGFGLFANHSLVMASYISRANAALIDLGELLDKG